MSEYVSFDFQAIPPVESYGLLTAFVQPRPIAFVSTLSREGVPNLAPFSFFMAGGSNPPSVCYSPCLSSKRIEKDSLINAEETGEFVINTVHRAMAIGMNETSASFPPHVSEWEHAPFDQIPSEIVKPARVAQSFAQMECRLFQVVRHGEGPTSARYIIGEVVRFHVRKELLTDGKPDYSKIESLGRLGGSNYIDTGTQEIFAMDRPG